MPSFTLCFIYGEFKNGSAYVIFSDKMNREPAAEEK